LFRSVDIRSAAPALVAFHAAKKVSNAVIVEQFIIGKDYRLLVINNVMVAAALRTPAHVVGDGVSTVQQLIDKVNSDPRRGYGHEKVLTQITVNVLTLTIIKDAGYTLDSVLAKDEILILKDTANLSTGGTA
ncbi:MAG TPA: cyanophycin synthetase, partial [Bacteroidetes bacterium]|nr:cyanophycin synthetase [Bacteroidota bacterium]